MAPTSATQERSEQSTDKTAIRPFHVSVPEAELTDLRRRIKATRWPEKETVADTSQGVPLAPLQDLARYKRPRTFVFVDAIRRGPNGKADYGWAKEAARAQLDKS